MDVDEGAEQDVDEEAVNLIAVVVDRSLECVRVPSNSNRVLIGPQSGRVLPNLS